MPAAFLFIVNSILLGVGLAMDAFSVSMANAIRDPHMERRETIRIAWAFALFQLLMPEIGWICVHTIINIFTSVQKFIPWIALILLVYIGGKLILEGVEERRMPAGEEVRHRVTGKDLLIQAVATSIDALSVGFAIAEYDFVMANTAGLIIGAVTFVICVCGLMIGKKAGTRLSWKASVLGGCILIAIGLEIFIKGMI